MDSYWIGKYVKLRLVKKSDRETFFIRNGYYRMMLKGHLEYEPIDNNVNMRFEEYFIRNHTYMHYHDFSLIICDARSDYPLGILEVFDSNIRNGTFYLGLYMDQEFERDEYYKETIMIVKDFMYNQLRYHVGFISLDSNQIKLEILLKKMGFTQSGMIKKRYYMKLDQYLFLIKKEELV